MDRLTKFETMFNEIMTTAAVDTPLIRKLICIKMTVKKILANLINKDIISKERIISYLNFFIRWFQILTK